MNSMKFECLISIQKTAELTTKTTVFIMQSHLTELTI